MHRLGKANSRSNKLLLAPEQAGNEKLVNSSSSGLDELEAKELLLSFELGIGEAQKTVIGVRRKRKMDDFKDRLEKQKILIQRKGKNKPAVVLFFHENTG